MNLKGNIITLCILSSIHYYCIINFTYKTSMSEDVFHLIIFIHLMIMTPKSTLYLSRTLHDLKEFVFRVFLIIVESTHM